MERAVLHVEIKMTSLLTPSARTGTFAQTTLRDYSRMALLRITFRRK